MRIEQIEKTVRRAVMLGRYFTGKATLEEESELQLLKERGELRENVVRKAFDSGQLGRSLELYRRLGATTEDNWKRWQAMRGSRMCGIRRLRRVGVAAAAIVALLIGGGTAWYLGYFPQTQEQQDAVFSIPVEYRKAYLLTSSEECFDLASDTVMLLSTEGMQVQTNKEGLHYRFLPGRLKSVGEPQQHTIVVPRGGEYVVMLPDSTRVWLNADSRLTYPVCFSGDAREVSFSGEAYFQVRKQTGKPFVVHTGRGDIRVWGTEFNVEAYGTEETLVATLVTGSISCSLPDGGCFLLHPKEQLTYTVGGGTTVTEVDTRLFCSWKEGRLFFRDKRLEEITCQLERWFDLEVVYLDEYLKDLHFSGNLDRFQDMGSFIKMFERSADIHFRLENNVLYVEAPRGEK